MDRKRVGRYEIVRLLARGGMAVVYLVRQPALDREVVLKRVDLESDDTTLAQRFVGEARLAAALDHPNVVTLFDFFEEDGVAYIAMEYVAGGSLRGLMGTLELAQVFGVAEGVLAGLGHAERHGIVHRDLKPENVLITRGGTVKIADFGIARAYNTLSERLTYTGMSMGTPAYMAPEQALNEPLGPYTDLYAVGVIVYEMLAGRVPFKADTPMTVLYSHVHQPPPPLSDLAPGVPGPVVEWVERLLAKAPSDRPASAREAWDELEEIAVDHLGPYWRRDAPLPLHRPAAADAPPAEETLPTTVSPDPPTATQPTPPERTHAIPVSQPTRRRHYAAVAAGVAVPAAILVAVLLTTGGHADRKPSAARDPAGRRVASPYDFDGDGRPELVAAMLRGAQRGSRTRSGVVLIHRPGRSWEVVTEATARLPGRPRASDAFGSGLASGDFDGDGSADLAVGTPGRNRVAVLYGTRGGLDGRRGQQLKGSKRFGFGVLARDFDGDRYDDLLVSTPGASVRLVPGGESGLAATRGRTVRPADRATLTSFGGRLEAGDLDGDRHIDIVEGAPTAGAATGHLTWCRGSPRGPQPCREIGSGASTSSLAVADVNGDGFDDIVQGDSKHGLLTPPVTGAGGEVRLWLGGRRGPRSTPITIDQNSPQIPGDDEPGDEFGGIVAAGDVDDDGFADIIVGAPLEDDGAGRVTVIRGGRAGYTGLGASSFDQASPGVPGAAAPGRQFGSTLAVLQLTRDPRPDLAVAVQGATGADDRIMVVEGGRGVFAPGETRTTTLGGLSRRVTAPPGGRIRIARMASG